MLINRDTKIFKWFLLCGIGGFVFVLSACSSAVLISNPDIRTGGVHYYLPKTLVTVEIVPYGLQATAGVVELTDEERAIATKKGAVRTHIIVQRKSYPVLVDATGKLTKELIIGLELRVKKKTEGNVTKKVIKNVADPETGRTLQYQSSSFATDRLCVGAGQNGLLKFVQAKVKDESGNIAIAVAQLGARLRGPEAAAFAELNAAQSVGPLPTIVEVQIDPLNRQDWTNIENNINLHFPQFRGQYQFSVDDVDYFLPQHQKSTTCPKNRICYRTKAPVRMRLQHKNTKHETMAYAEVVNRAVTHNIDVTRAMLVEKVTLLKFEEGVLTSVKIKKPSEVLKMAQLPLTIWDTIVVSALAAPGDFIDKVIPGTSKKSYDEAIDLYKQRIEKLDNLSDNLKSIRNGFLNVNSNDVDENQFKLKCS